MAGTQPQGPPELLPDPEQIKREERKIVEETEKAGGHVHEFNPDASPAEKAAAAGKVPHPQSATGPQFMLTEPCRACHWAWT